MDQQDPISCKRRLFFAQAAQQTTEQQLTAWFSQFGTVEQVELYRDLNANTNSGNTNSGYGYVTMATSEQAAAALSAVQQNPPAGCPVQYLNLSCPVTVAVEDPSAPAVDPHTTLVANANRTVRLEWCFLAAARKTLVTYLFRNNVCEPQAKESSLCTCIKCRAFLDRAMMHVHKQNTLAVLPKEMPSSPEVGFALDLF